MPKVNLNDATTLQDLVAAINANNTLLEAFLDKVLSRDGQAPNAMESNIDMNGNRVFNLPAPSGPTEPLRLQDASGTTVVTAVLSPFITTLVNDANAAEARTTLGLGALATLNTVGAAQIDANAVTTAKILDANVTDTKLALDAVTTAKILDSNVTANKLATNSVTTTKITDANVTRAKLAADAYEEGSWTPGFTINGSATGITFGSRAGRYIKVGNLVHVWGFIVLTSKGASVGEASITALPFTSSNIASLAYIGTLQLANAASISGDTHVRMDANATSMKPGHGLTGSASTLVNTNITNTTECYFQLTYRTG